MASELQNLSGYDPGLVPDASDFTFGVVVAQWNHQITDALWQGAYKTLLEHGVKEENIIKIQVPGSFELTFGAKLLLEKPHIDAVIALGCVIRGETPHFEYISEAVSNGLTQLNVMYRKPVIFGVLTTNTLDQAIDRAGGKYGNKGVEAAVTAIKMADLNAKFKAV